MKPYLILQLLLFVCQGWSQSALVSLRSPEHYHWLERMDIKFKNPTNLHTSIKGIPGYEFYRLATFVDSAYQNLSDLMLSELQEIVDQQNEWLFFPSIHQKEYIDSTQIFYTLRDQSSRRLKYRQSEKPILKHFYKTPAHFFEIRKPHFRLTVDPLLQFDLATAKDDMDPLFVNQRGISLRGTIDDVVYFYTDILESQARYSNYVRAFTSKFAAVPGSGFYKTYQSSLFDFTEAVDFLLARAFVGVHISPHVSLELGHNRHFIGNGIRSLFLSDFAPEYFYLKLNTRVWKFQYQNIFGELLRNKRGGGDILLPKKYFAAHYLSLNVLPNLNLGLFETVVFARENQFELQYLNPIILYRTVEGALGSPDNVLLGLDLKWNLWSRLSLYSQFVLDEFKIGEVRARNGWWANKFGVQAGLKYIDVLSIPYLDLQIEFNAIRPYTYSHGDSITNYSHYNQALAHPLGANVQETLFLLRYQPGLKWIFTLRGMFAKTGEDTNDSNWGSNILLDNHSREMDYGNKIGQGLAADIKLVGGEISYKWFPGFYIDVFFQNRTKTTAVGKQIDNYAGLGIRWNLTRKWLGF